MLPPDSKVRSFSLGWAAIDTMVQQASGLSLTTMLPTQVSPNLAPLRVRLIDRPEPESGPSTDHLAIDVAGVGRLHRIYMTSESNNRWSIDHRLGSVRLQGSVQVAATGLSIDLEEGTMGISENALTFSPTTLALEEVF